MPSTSILPSNGKLQLAVVTGGHTFPVPPFYDLFRALPDVDFYPQALDEFTAAPDLALRYDVVVFYTMHQFARDASLPWYQSQIFPTLERLGGAGQGLLVLHHALVAFPEWELWSEMVGIENRRDIEPHFEQQVSVELADTKHPITQGLKPWTLADETYEMAEPRREDGNHLLLCTSHPHSMKTLGWTRSFRDSRVFCWQSGHDEKTFRDPNFRLVLHNAIRWLGGAKRDGENEI